MSVSGSPSRTKGSTNRGALSVPPQSWWSRLWSPFWALPLASIIGAFCLGIVVPIFDALIAEHVPFLFQGGDDGARTILGAIAAATISVTGLVFSITMVVLQLSSSQFTPRVIGSFLDSRVAQFTFGVFTGTFVFALTVMRSVGRPDSDSPVPQTAVSLAFVFVLASVLVLLFFIHHITNSIQVSKVLADIGDHGVGRIIDLYSEDERDLDSQSWQRPSRPRRIAVYAEDRHGCTSQINFSHLVALAESADAVIEITQPIGRFHAEGQLLAEMWINPLQDDDSNDGPEERERAIAKRVANCFWLEAEPSARQDPSFSCQQIVDIALRALSPGVNDPTTAVQALNEVHRMARAAVLRTEPASALRDDDENIRVIYQPFGVGVLLDLAFDEIAYYGRDAPAVRARIGDVLDDLSENCRPAHRKRIAKKRREINKIFAGKTPE
ncbi:hypothetical protein FM104_06565 [Microbacterium esteraromaticum]|uniref:DUF2254 domain-containing protein n=1 Tax=Microbacterium esteraromaticum TaxID=57043 RepID=A0A1R4JCP1_9MICO|nr:DUF2254 domain-containing protein [Microbacterium esteraromaticum]SJN29565.1 hypothetical protein FM104_06565 [Microbacterium esteraromaticum]